MTEINATPPDRYADLLGDVMHIYDSLNAWTIAEGYREVAHIANGWFLRALRSAQAILLLNENELYDVAAPNRRCLIEHAIALSWLAAEGDAIAITVKRAHRVGVGKLSDALTTANWSGVDQSVIDEILREAEDEDDRNDYLMSFVNRCRKFGDPGDLPPYFAETHRSHPDWESAAEYFKEGDPSSVDVPPRRVSQVDICVLYMIRCLDAVDTIIEGNPWDARLGQLKAEILTRSGISPKG